MENTFTVGSTYTTLKSGVTGTIQEVVRNNNGSIRLRLLVNGETRWSTIPASALTNREALLATQ